jgi:hypothetical protein
MIFSMEPMKSVVEAAKELGISIWKLYRICRVAKIGVKDGREIRLEPSDIEAVREALKTWRTTGGRTATPANRIELNGESLSAREYARRTGTPWRTVYHRLARARAQ